MTEKAHEDSPWETASGVLVGKANLDSHWKRLPSHQRQPHKLGLPCQHKWMARGITRHDWERERGQR